MVVFLLLYHRNPRRKMSSLAKSGASFVLLHVKSKAKMVPCWCFGCCNSDKGGIDTLYNSIVYIVLNKGLSVFLYQKK